MVRLRNLFGMISIWFGVAVFWQVENYWINLYWFTVSEESFGVPPEAWMVAVMVVVTAIVAIFTYFTFGAISDATKHKLGRRRPWIILGSILGGLSMMLFPTVRLVGNIFLAVFLAVLIDSVLTFFGDFTTPTRKALVADVTTLEERGKVNSILQIPEFIGILLILGLSPLIAKNIGESVGDLNIGNDAIFYLGGFAIIVFGVLGAFFVQEPTVTEPQFKWTVNFRAIFQKNVFTANKEYFKLIGIVFIGNTAMNVFYPYLAPWLRTTLELEPLEESIVLGGTLLFAILSSFILGVLVDRLGRKKTMTAFAGLQFVFLLMLSTATPDNIIIPLIFGAAWLCMYTGWLISSVSWAQDLVPKENRATLLAFYDTALVLAMVPGSALGAFISDTTRLVPGTISSLIFVAGAFLILLSAPLVLLVFEPKPNSTKSDII
ncbi:MAG: MFS transporter [Candidatus Hodarchaeales archaeon]